MYFHLIILAFYTVFLGCLTANSIHISSVTPTRVLPRNPNFNVSISDLLPDTTLMDQNYPNFRIGSFSVSLDKDQGQLLSLRCINYS